MRKPILLLLSFLSSAAFSASGAQEPRTPQQALGQKAPKQQCEITQSFELQSPGSIFCDGNLVFADDVEIETHDHPLEIRATGRVFYGKEGNGVKIHAQSGGIVISARTASGQLRIDGKDDQLGGDVSIDYVSTYRYTQNVKLGYGGVLETRLNGEFVSF